MSDTLLACLSFAATVGFYLLAKLAYRHKKVFWLSPMVAVPVALVAFVMLLHIPLPDYFRYTNLLVLMLGPATIAFAVPIYQQRETIRRFPLTLMVGVATGVVMGLLSSWLLVQIFPMPDVAARSMLTRSVSTPFAMQVTEQFGGVPDLTAMLVLMTGVVGMLICEPAFRLARIRTSLAKGAALGAASHGAGTAKAHEIGREEGVIASLTMIFTGIAMVIGAPLFASLV
ncbi:LrgB family protein [Oceanobacter mangrovi]|uniref:LrgB family protein n=1 Tax=Oceanobacter mangrovi TaxID=2862510 RepID=UPI001C8D61F7|nr:LrgB family protein [Oceanobacter mangrovi]